MSEDDFRDLSSEPDDEETQDEATVEENETEPSTVQPEPQQEFDQSDQEFKSLEDGGEVADDSNKDGAPATTRESSTTSEDFEAAVKGKVEQYDQDEVLANSGPRPVGLPEANQITVVEPQAEESGYVIDKGEHNAQPYVVQEDSVLSGHPWNVQPGTVQGRSQNPPLSDDLAKELGLDKLV